MKVVMFYEVAQDGIAKAQTNYAGHRARLDEFHARGVLLMAGPYANPVEGAMGVFTSREAAEEFIQGDPFVINGVVGKWSLREWNEVLA
ncbi:MAG: YciI family protein [Burkholderiales bacterium]|nr:YciI family protein [Burkholderiales bacterium]